MARTYRNSIVVLLITLFLSMTGQAIEYTKGKAVDSYIGNSISRAFVTLGNDVSQTDENGVFIISSRGDKVAVRTWGHLRTEQAITEPL